MLDELKDAIEFTSKFNNFEDDFLIEIRKDAIENRVPIITKDVAAFLNFICEIKKPKDILEIGTAIGYSGALMLSASDNSHLTTIERNYEMYKIGDMNLEKHFNRRFNIINKDALEYINEIDKKFDLIFIDANKSKYKEIFDLIYPKLRNEGIIIIDNVLFRGYVYKNNYPKRYKTIVKNLEKLISYLSDEYNAKILPFGDGICLVNKK